jgi:hypothetical protein
MISMTYDLGCETLRFAGEMILSLLRALRFVRAGRRNGLGLDPASCLKERRQRRRVSKGAVWAPSAWRREKVFFEAVPPRLRAAFETRPRTRKKLRERAANRLKSLARVNLCARRCARPASYSRPRLSPGPASASARPTSRPRSSIEVCSRTVRSSPLACRSACSGERATLTATFDSTSGWR